MAYNEILTVGQIKFKQHGATEDPSDGFGYLYISDGSDGGATGDLILKTNATTSSTVILATKGTTTTLGETTLLSTTTQLQFRDSGIYINSNADGKMTISADGTGTDDITIAGSVTANDGITFSGTITNALMFSGVTTSTNTNGTLFSTGSAWITHATAGQCAFKILASSTATTGDYATMRIRGRADAVSTGGVEAINASASANIANYENLCAGYFAVQPMAINTTSASSIATAMHAVIDRTGTSSGRTWVEWIDTHQETKSGAGDYLTRWSHNGTVANDGMATIYIGGRMPAMFNFEDVSGFLTTSATALSGVTTSYKIACTIAGVGTVYIPVITSGMA